MAEACLTTADRREETFCAGCWAKAEWQNNGGQNNKRMARTDEFPLCLDFLLLLILPNMILPLINERDIQKARHHRVGVSCQRREDVLETLSGHQRRNAADEDDVVIEPRAVFEAEAQVRTDEVV